MSRRGRESLQSDNSHTVHDRASLDCKAVSKSFPYGFHLPLLQSNFDMVSQRSAERRREKPSVNHLKLQLSAYRPKTAGERVNPPLKAQNRALRAAPNSIILPVRPDAALTHARMASA